MLKNIFSAVSLAIILSVATASFIVNPPNWQTIPSQAELESYLHSRLIYAQPLKGIASEVLRASGQRERDGVFFTEDGLLENYWPSDGDSIALDNATSIVNFSDKYNVPTMVVVVPTAVAIKQEQVSDYAPLFNQKVMLNELSNKMEGHVSFVDVYPTLLGSYDLSGEYLYYRTTPDLTMLGGYRVYSTIAERMRLTPYSLRDFEREYIYHDLRGSLVEVWPDEEVKSDILSLYHFSGAAHSVSMVVQDSDGLLSHYDTFYPTSTTDDPLDVYMGGEAVYTEIEQVSGDGWGRLLVFGDKSANSILPFLSLHFVEVTYINLDEIDTTQLKELDVESYDQVLFCYGMETFCDNDTPTLANRVL